MSSDITAKRLDKPDPLVCAWLKLRMLHGYKYVICVYDQQAVVTSFIHDPRFLQAVHPCTGSCKRARAILSVSSKSVECQLTLVQDRVMGHVKQQRAMVIRKEAFRRITDASICTLAHELSMVQ